MHPLLAIDNALLVCWLFGTKQHRLHKRSSSPICTNEHTLMKTCGSCWQGFRTLVLWSLVTSKSIKLNIGIKLSFLCVFVFSWVKTTHGEESKTWWGKLSWGTKTGWDWLPPHWRCPAHNSTCEEYITDYMLCCIFSINCLWTVILNQDWKHDPWPHRLNRLSFIFHLELFFLVWSRWSLPMQQCFP